MISYPPSDPPSAHNPRPYIRAPLSISDFTPGCMKQFVTIYNKADIPAWYYPVSVTAGGVHGYIWAQFVWVPLTLSPEFLEDVLDGMNGGSNCVGPRYFE